MQDELQWLARIVRYRNRFHLEAEKPQAVSRVEPLPAQSPGKGAPTLRGGQSRGKKGSETCAECNPVSRCKAQRAPQMVIVFVGEQHKIDRRGLAAVGKQSRMQLPLRQTAVDEKRTLHAIVLPLHKERVTRATASQAAKAHPQRNYQRNDESNGQRNNWRNCQRNDESTGQRNN